ncbi:EamA family transporter [Saccharibacter sp. 17.LH.SD]|uniref:DMT family transporter n=1 Tax=Saccharibacter sp. 17.LH.SD TaxID=2689393 RepID=UPI00136AB8A8|nr:EamA family transporter [Saccharibacter sp. 17.LH.SD]MXV45042.1 EamA family transporter [Saccharibacter sp. 17.LH.SD]
MSESSKETVFGLISITLAAILWGTTGVAASFAPQISAITMGAIAMGGGGLLQAIRAAPFFKKSLPALKKQWPITLLGGIAVMVYPLAFYSSMRLAGITVGTVISMGSAPLFAAIVDMVMDGVRPSKRWGISTSLGILGIALLSFAESFTHSQPTATTAPAPLVGILIGLIAGFTYSFYSWAARHLMHHAILPRAAMGSIFGVGSLFLLPIILTTGKSLFYSWNNVFVGCYMILIPMFLGYLCFGYGLARVPASTATTITLLEPTVAAILAVLIVGERLPLAGWSGIALIMASLICITWPRKRLKHP